MERFTVADLCVIPNLFRDLKFKNKDADPDKSGQHDGRKMKFKYQYIVFTIIFMITIMGSKLHLSDQTKSSLTPIQKKQKQLDNYIQITTRIIC